MVIVFGTDFQSALEQQQHFRMWYRFLQWNAVSTQ